jgi:hypothetical protein
MNMENGELFLENLNAATALFAKTKTYKRYLCERAAADMVNESWVRKFKMGRDGFENFELNALIFLWDNKDLVPELEVKIDELAKQSRRTKNSVIKEIFVHAAGRSLAIVDMENGDLDNINPFLQSITQPISISELPVS